MGAGPLCVRGVNGEPLDRQRGYGRSPGRGARLRAWRPPPGRPGRAARPGPRRPFVSGRRGCPPCSSRATSMSTAVLRCRTDEQATTRSGFSPSSSCSPAQLRYANNPGAEAGLSRRLTARSGCRPPPRSYRRSQHRSTRTRRSDIAAADGFQDVCAEGMRASQEASGRSSAMGTRCANYCANISQLHR